MLTHTSLNALSHSFQHKILTKRHNIMRVTPKDPDIQTAAEVKVESKKPHQKN